MALIHFAVLVAVLLPIYAFLRIYQRSRGEFTNAFFLLLASFLPLMAYHFIDAMDIIFGVSILPPSGSGISIIEHGSAILAYVSLAAFFFWYNKSFVMPVYGL